MKHNIKYNSQRDNYSFKGKFKAWWQCFSTSSWMFMSFYSGLIDGKDDNGLSIYLDDVETKVGKPGIGEIIKRKYKWITGGTSFWWLVQKAGIGKYLNADGIEGKAIFIDRIINYEKLRTLIKRGPVILQTKKIGRLPSGHIILAIGYDKSGIICHDPFGNAMTFYSDKDGKAVKYPDDYLRLFTGEKIRCIYWSD